jgi:hypothetical protein
MFLSERMLRKDYSRKSSVEKIVSCREPQEARCQDELIGGIPTVLKQLCFTLDLREK